MSGTTFTYIGPTDTAEVANSPSLWSPTGVPGFGDTAVINAGTLLLVDASLQSNTVIVASPTLISLGGTQTHGPNNPTVDSNSEIDTQTSSGPANATIDAWGNFVNDGTIAADGPAGSKLTIDIAGTTLGGTYVPGTFINYGELAATTGNSLIIQTGGTSDLLNAGRIYADGGYVDVAVAPGAINGGMAAIANAVVVEQGGTFETNAAYPTTATGTEIYYAFADPTPGNTIKIDDVGFFGGRFIGFGAGDTIDIGTSLAIDTVIYNSSNGLLYLENAGSIEATLLFGSGAFESGTFAVTGSVGPGHTATAGSFGLTFGSDGDTEIVSSVQNDVYDNTSGTWHTASSWSTGVPGTLDTVLIGLNASAPFTLRTGTVAVSAGAVVLGGGTLDITSATTIHRYSLSVFAGALEVASGHTLTTPLLRLVSGLALLNSGAVLDATGHANYGSGTVAHPGAVNGTLAVVNGDTSAIDIGGGTLLVEGGTIDAGGFIHIGHAGSGAPAQVTIEATGTQHASVTDSYALIGSGIASFGALTLSGNVNWTDAGDPNDPTPRGYMWIGYDGSGPAYPPGTAPAVSGTAQLLVENGATLTETNYVHIGHDVGSAGSATIETGGIWNINPTGTTGLQLGSTGSGTLDILVGGTVAIGVGGFSSGNSLGGDGTLLVTGTGALLADAGGWGDGLSGHGYAKIADGGKVELTDVRGIGVGQSAGSSGTLIIGDTTVGASAEITLGADNTGVSAGQAGHGLLEILNNGTLSDQDVLDDGVDAGVSATAAGTIVVAGTGAVITIGTAGGAMHIGRLGHGTLIVGNGGSVLISGNNLDVGGEVSSGTLIPQGGSGFVEMTGGGLLQSASDLNVFASSTVTVDQASAIDLGQSGDFETGQILVESDHHIEGNGVVDAEVMNDGTIQTPIGGTLEVKDQVNGAGRVVIFGTSEIKLDGAVSSGQTIIYDPSPLPETLFLRAPSAVNSFLIENWQVGDTLALGQRATGADWLGDGTVDVFAGGSTFEFRNVSFGPGIATPTFDTSNGVVELVSCFAQGTLIGTRAGSVPIELLREGDLLTSVLDGMTREVIWIGNRSVNCARHPNPDTVWPVRVSAHAFGEGMPARDLVLSPDHAVYVDEVLIPVKYLINGTTIRQETVSRITYYHVELDQHDVILAEGLPAETYLDVGDRSNFANGGVLVRLHVSLADTWEMRGAAPLVITGPLLERVRQRVQTGTAERRVG